MINYIITEQKRQTNVYKNFNFLLIFSMEAKIMESQKCVLYDRDCIGCLECEMCDLDPNKVCDNCGKCLDIKDYATIRIDRVVGISKTAAKHKK